MVGEVIGPPRAHPLWQLTDTELDTRLTRLAAAHHTIAALRGQAALVADERDTARELGYTSAAALIADTSPLNLAQAHRITKLTARLTRLADMDEKYRPVLDAYNSDQLAGPHAELIAKFVKRNCNRIPEVAQTAVVATLLAFGADPDTQQLKNTITTLDESLDTEDGTPPACEDSDLDALHISRTLAGRVVINGDLNKLCGEMLLELMNALDVQQTGDDGTTLARTPEQLRADTFGELLRRAPAAAKLPDTGGARPNVNVTIDWETLNSDDEPGLFDDITDSHAAGETHHDGCGPHRRSPSQRQQVHRVVRRRADRRDRTQARAGRENAVGRRDHPRPGPDDLL